MSRTGNPEIDLQLAALGIPRWLDHFQRFNSLQSWVLYGFSVYVAFVSSFWQGVAYVVCYTLGRAAILAVGMNATQNMYSPGPFIAAVLIATLATLAFNVGIITHHLALWDIASVL